MINQSQKGFATIPVIIVAIVLVVGGVVGFKYWQEKSHVSPITSQQNLRTYRNDQYGFEFQYPVNESIQENKNAEKEYDDLWTAQVSGLNDQDDYLVEIRLGNHYDIRGATRIKIGGEVAYTLVDSGYGGADHVYVIPLGKNYLTFLAAKCDVNNKGEGERCDKNGLLLENTILSTFKFTK